MSNRLAFVLLAALLLDFKANAQITPPELEWRVENRFPILQVDAFKDVDRMWEASPNKSMWSFIVRRLEALEHGPRDAFLLVDPKKANSAPNAATTEQVLVRLDAKVPDSAACRWTVNPAPLKSPEEGKCSDTMEIKRNTPTSVSVKHAGGAASTVVEVDEIVVVAMGDSYASGEGSPDRPAIYKGFSTPKRNDWFLAGGVSSMGKIEPAIWLDETCHRSLLSWPVLSSLRLALEHPQAVVRLINVTCSGAEFMDGFFLAQKKDAILSRKLTSERDGNGRRFYQKDVGTFLPKSQVNAVRDALCPYKTNNVQDISPPKLPFRASARECDRPSYQPDVLLMTGGGNDIKFGAAVMGVLMPSVARTMAAVPVLDMVRKFAGAIPPEELTARARELSGDYEDYLKIVAWGAKVDPSQAVLITYPNPVALQVDAKRSVCKPFEERLEASFMAFSPSVRIAFPKRVRRYINWAVEISRSEETEFITRAYPAVREMQQKVAKTFNLVEWLDQNYTDDEVRSFKTRLLCTAWPEGSRERQRQDELEPIFFCQLNSGECKNAPYLYRESLDSWHFMAPGRRIVNATNDSLLAQRSWPAHKQPDLKELMAALSGTFHPIAESHAVAADAAYGGLCSVLQKQSKHRGKLCAGSETAKTASAVPPLVQSGE